MDLDAAVPEVLHEKDAVLHPGDAPLPPEDDLLLQDDEILPLQDDEILLLRDDVRGPILLVVQLAAVLEEALNRTGVAVQTIDEEAVRGTTITADRLTERS